MYNIFSECKDYTLDPYWQDIFEQCYLGKFPRNFKYTKNCVTLYENNKISEIVTVDEDDPPSFFKTVLSIFKKKLNLISDRDSNIQQIKLNIAKEQVKSNWKQLRQKNVKNNLLLNYVVDMKNKYNLSTTDTERLISSIRLGFIFKTIVSDDIVYIDGKIRSIKGIDFVHNGNRYEFTCNIFNYKIKNEKQNNEVFNVTTVIEKYMKEYKASCIQL
jgi:hypothetical protein